MTGRPTPPDGGVIFLHIPKTGGSTLRTVLDRQYPPEASYFQRGGGEQQRRYLQALRERRVPEQWEAIKTRNRAEVDSLATLDEASRSRLRLVAGHFWYGIHESLPGSWTYLTMMRHPVDRVLSLHAHRVRYHGIDMTLEEYVSEAADFDQLNGQTRRIASQRGERTFGPLARDSVETAKRNLALHFPVVGLTERFDESLVVMTRVLGWRPMGYVPLLVSEGRAPRDAIADHVRRGIEEQNALDLELYDYAVALFDERLADQPPLERDLQRLERLKARARRLAPLMRIRRRARRLRAAAARRRGRR